MRIARPRKNDWDGGSQVSAKTIPVELDQF